MDRNMTTPAKIEPWIECAVWEIDSRCLETGAFFNRNKAANIIAAHAPKPVWTDIKDFIAEMDEARKWLHEQPWYKADRKEWEAKEKALRELAERWKQLGCEVTCYAWLACDLHAILNCKQEKP